MVTQMVMVRYARYEGTTYTAQAFLNMFKLNVFKSRIGQVRARVKKYLNAFKRGSGRADGRSNSRDTTAPFPRSSRSPSGRRTALLRLGGRLPCRRRYRLSGDS